VLYPSMTAHDPYFPLTRARIAHDALHSQVFLTELQVDSGPAAWMPVTHILVEVGGAE
jgi:hypothetical protein